MNSEVISPTGFGIRGTDRWGSGEFLAPRNGGYHEGADYICTPGQGCFMPVRGKILRECRPYVDFDYSGVLIRCRQMLVTLFYLQPFEKYIGEEIEQGEIIGVAQNIARKIPGEKYPGMTPHIHMELLINPHIYTYMI